MQTISVQISVHQQVTALNIYTYDRREGTKR